MLATWLVLLLSLLNLVCDAVQQLYFSLLLEYSQIAVEAIATATIHMQPASMHGGLGSAAAACTPLAWRLSKC